MSAGLLDGRGPFTQVRFCSVCKGVVSYYATGLDPSGSTRSWKWWNATYLEWSSSCPFCGNDKDFPQTGRAAWVPTWSWWAPWTWGSGYWYFAEDFQRALTGQSVEGGEVSLVHDGGKNKS
jgi:hypothetical protein